MRMIKCKRCGQIIQTDKDKAYCDVCRTEIRRESVVRDRICADCGTSFKGFPRSYRCPDCQRDHKRIAKAEYREREKRGTTRKVGETDNCQKCGKPYTINSGMQKYCEDCSAEALAENIRAHKRDYMSEHVSESLERKVRLKTNRRVCAVCGQTFTAKDSGVTCSPECAEVKKNERKERARAWFERRNQFVAARRAAEKAAAKSPETDDPKNPHSP